MVDDDADAMDEAVRWAVRCPICEDKPGHFDDAGSVEVRCPNNCTEPEQVYRVLEELPDGRVRYESLDGIETGTRVGMFVVRDGLHIVDPLETCEVCEEPHGFDDVSILDDLTYRGRSLRTVVPENAMRFADEISRRGKTEKVREWVYAQFPRDHRGEPIQSFREWQESQQ